MNVCPTCDGYGVVADGSVAMKCPDPSCRGRISTTQALAELYCLSAVGTDKEAGT